eukprot:GHVQ01013928.1.p1 GENE.GHVQ01013928.1~~GHVQ01013928.1.p1  ORF type:complete len:842 (+),score=148.46 GHVQ01013928.1:273-2798(+)
MMQPRMRRVSCITRSISLHVFDLQKPAAKKGGKGPTSAAAKLALERMRKIEEAERQQREQEEKEKKLEEEATRRDAEENQRAEEDKERRRVARVDKRERDRKEGKLLSAKDKAREQKNQALREQLEAQGLIPTAGAPGEKKKKVIDDRKTRKKKKAAEDVQVPADNLEVTPQSGNEKKEDEASLGVEKAVTEDWEDGVLESSADDIPSKATQGNMKATVESQSETESDSEEDEAEDVHHNSKPKDGKSEEPRRLRSPICCILGHVDTGKTKLLDKIRKTNVQDNEAGGITQQIGATFCPTEALSEQCKKVEFDLNLEVPGLLIIDTPGHESFNNLRARGSSLCDIAILVIDIMHGMEPQTRESLGLLKARKCPFVIALNKIDRMYGWIACDWETARKALKKQPQHAQDEFDKRYHDVLSQLQSEGMNCQLYWENEDVRKVVSIVPTSAINGEGLPDLLMLLIKLTQDIMSRNLQLLDEFQCTILEVKAIDGLGVTVDVILANGTLREGDDIVVCGMSGPIVTTVRAVLTPQPMKELRVKGEYIHHKEIHAAMGVKISAHSLDEAVAGTSVLRYHSGDDLEQLKENVMADMATIFDSVDRSGSGVYVMASTLGSLEALLQFLKDSKIPVFAVNIGTVHKMDVKKASVMREKGHPELSVILAFDIKVDPEAEKEAKSLGVRVMTADIIYHLFDEFTKYVQENREEKKRDKAGEAVFPCVMSVLSQYIFNKKDPIVLGVKIDDGILRVGTPLTIPDKEFLKIGRVSSLEHNKKAVEVATKGMEVAIKIIGEPSVTFGRQFDHTNKIYSRISRDSIDCLKEHFRDELSKDDWKLVIAMKKIFGIP